MFDVLGEAFWNTVLGKYYSVYILFTQRFLGEYWFVAKFRTNFNAWNLLDGRLFDDPMCSMYMNSRMYFLGVSLPFLICNTGVNSKGFMVFTFRMLQSPYLKPVDSHCSGVLRNYSLHGAMVCMPWVYLEKSATQKFELIAHLNVSYNLILGTIGSRVNLEELISD
jgi:hypothetical protein